MTTPSNNKMEIAGKRTVADWKNLKDKLDDHPNLWETAFDDFFYSRLETRYLNPIHLLQTHGENTGEGFSIVSLQCALVEFLQTTRDGASFRQNGGNYLARSCKIQCNCEPRCEDGCNKICQSPSGGCKDHGVSVYGYGKSRKIFSKFLTEQEPFKTNFDKTLAKDFYSNVRCSLLHEARTTGNWRITANSKRSETITKEKGITFLQRDHFQRDLEAYIWRYKIELLSDTELQKAFIRKFDALCEQ